MNRRALCSKIVLMMISFGLLVMSLFPILPTDTATLADAAPAGTRGPHPYHGQPTIDSVFIPMDEVEFKEQAKDLAYTIIDGKLYVGDPWKGGYEFDFESGTYTSLEHKVNFGSLPTGVVDAEHKLPTINGKGANYFNFARFHSYPYEGYTPLWGQDGYSFLNIEIYDFSTFANDYQYTQSMQTLALHNLTGFPEPREAQITVHQFFSTMDGKVLLFVEAEEKSGAYEKHPLWLLHDIRTDETVNLGAEPFDERSALDFDTRFYFSDPYVYWFENTDVFQDSFFPTQVGRWNIEDDTVAVHDMILWYAVDKVRVKPAGDRLYVLGGETGETSYYRHEDGTITHDDNGDADAVNEGSDFEDWGPANIRVQCIDFTTGKVTLASELFYDGLISGDGDRPNEHEYVYPCDYDDGTYAYFLSEVNQLFTWAVDKPDEGFIMYRWKYPSASNADPAPLQPPNDVWIEWKQGDEKCYIEWNAVPGAKGYRVYDPRLLYKEDARISAQLVTETSYEFTLEHMEERVAGKDWSWYVVSSVAADDTESSWSINGRIYSEIFHLADNWKEPYGVTSDEGSPGFGLPVLLIAVVALAGAGYLHRTRR